MDMLEEIRRHPRALAYALLVHLGLFLVMAIGLQWPNTPTPSQPQAEVVKAVVLDEKKVQAEVERLKKAETAKQKKEEARLRKLKRDLDRTKQDRRKEEKRLKDAKRKRSEEKKKREQAKIAEEKRLTKLKKERETMEMKRRTEEKRLADLESKRRMEEQRRAKIEAEREREAAEAAARQKEMEEEEQRLQAARERQAQTEQAKYIAIIKQRVNRNWIRPSGNISSLECKVRVHLIPGGDVIDAKVVTSSGNAIFDRSAETAVRKASPLPVPSDPFIFDRFRNFTFTFRPEG